MRQETVLGTIGSVECLVVALAPHAGQGHLIVNPRSMTWERLLSLQEIVVLFAVQSMESAEGISFNRGLSIASYGHLSLVLSLTDDINRCESLNVLRLPWNHESIRSLILTDVESLIELLLVALFAVDFEPLDIVRFLVLLLRVGPRIGELQLRRRDVVAELTLSLLVAHPREETGLGRLVFVLVVLTDFAVALLVDLVGLARHLVLDQAGRGLIQRLAVGIFVVHFVGLVGDGHEQLLLLLAQVRIVHDVDIAV